LLYDKIEKIRNFFFIIALFAEVIFVIIDKSRLTNPYTTWCFRITFILFTLVVLLTERTKREWLILALALAFGVFCYTQNGREETIRIIMFVAACKFQPLKNRMYLLYITTFVGCVGIAVLSITGVFGELYVTDLYRLDDGVVSRFTLGFGHPNALACMFYMLLLLTLYLLDRKFRWYLYFIPLLLSIGMYFLSGSRTTFIMCVFSILISIIMHYPNNEMTRRDAVWQFIKIKDPSSYYAAGVRYKLIPYILCFVVIAACVVFSILSAKYSEHLFTKGMKSWRIIDKLINNRIGNLYFTDGNHEGTLETWSLFSSPSATGYFDMGWVRLFYWYGIIPAALAILCIIFFIIECRRKNDGQAIMVLASLAIYTVVEAHMISVYIGRNFLLLMMGAYFAEGFLFENKQDVFLWEVMNG